MRVAIMGAGNVGVSIARELIAHGHETLLIERDPHAIRSDTVPQADWLLADGCELDALVEADLSICDVSVAATGDDRANLVHALLAKTEFGVPRTIARVNHPDNEWLFDDQWGVDVAVSTPRIMAALVEEAVTVGQVVSLLKFRGGTVNLVELTLPPTSPAVGRTVGEVVLPGDAVLVALVRDDRVGPPGTDAVLQGNDELFFLIEGRYVEALTRALAPAAA